MHRKRLFVTEHPLLEDSILPFTQRGQCFVDSETNASTFAGQKVRQHILWANLMPLGGLCDIPVTCCSTQVLKC